MQLSDFTPGMRVWSRKWMTYGTVDHPAKKLVHVKMDNTGTIRALPVDDLEIAAQRQLTYIRNAQLPPLPKLKSTRQYPPRDTAPALTSRQQRTQRRAGGFTDVTRMMMSG